jgi:hypothetical protein
VLQSPIDYGLSFGEPEDGEKDEDFDDFDLDAATPWDTVVEYNNWNEKLERLELPDTWKAIELKYYNLRGLNRFHGKYAIASLHGRKAPLWEGKGKNQRSYVERLTQMREEMDAIIRSYYPPDTVRAFLPYTLKYEADYDFAKAVEEDDNAVTEEDLVVLDQLKDDPDVWTRGLFAPNYEMMHRGGVYEDFASVKMQTLPQEVHFPWDYPAIKQPNVPSIWNESFVMFKDEAVEKDPMLKHRALTFQHQKRVLARHNEVQNKNVWFLDPIALNTRFLANNPSPFPFRKMDRWTHKSRADDPDIKAANTLHRFIQKYLGKSHATSEDAQSGHKTSPEKTISAKIIPGDTKR